MQIRNIPGQASMANSLGEIEEEFDKLFQACSDVLKSEKSDDLTAWE